MFRGTAIWKLPARKPPHTAVTQPSKAHSWASIPEEGNVHMGSRTRKLLLALFIVQFSSVAQSWLTFCDPMNCSTQGLPVHHQLPDSTHTHVHQSMMPSNHLILCHPLLLLSPIPPCVRVFSNELTLLMRWPKYWSFSLGIIPSKEHPGLISFRMD